MIYYKKPNEVELIRQNCLLVSKTLALVGSMLKPGITGKKLDEKAEEFIRDNDAKPAFKGYRGFPASLCISPNEEVVHGIPNEKEFVEGDIVSIDCGVEKNGFFGDSAYTFAIGEIDPEVEKLMQVTKKSLYRGIRAARPGNKVGDISYAIQNYAERKHGYGIVRELVGHGIGKALHESPEVPNFGRKGKGEILKPGLTIAIEPMVNLGTKRVKQYPDGWTIKSRDKKPSAHYEHTICVTKKGPDILSDHDMIEDAIKKNDNIREIAIKT
jgi:methionyl aminopeptidase